MIEPRQGLIPYQDDHMLSLSSREGLDSVPGLLRVILIEIHARLMSCAHVAVTAQGVGDSGRRGHGAGDP